MISLKKTCLRIILAAIVAGATPPTGAAAQVPPHEPPPVKRVVPTAGLGTAMRERMRDRAITNSLPAIGLSSSQREEIRRIQRNFRVRHPGTRGATEPELAVYHARILHVLTPTQRERLRVTMKRHWIEKHAP